MKSRARTQPRSIELRKTLAMLLVLILFGGQTVLASTFHAGEDDCVESAMAPMHAGMMHMHAAASQMPDAASDDGCPHCHKAGSPDCCPALHAGTASAAPHGVMPAVRRVLDNTHDASGLTQPRVADLSLAPPLRPPAR